MDRLHPRRGGAARRARSSTRRRPGRRRPAAAPSRRCSSRTSAARRRSSRRSATTSSGAASRDELEAKGVRLHVCVGRRAAAPRRHVRRRRGRAHDHRDRREAPAARRRRARSRGRSCAGRDCVYFTGGDVEALSKARHARVLVATARELPTLGRAGVELDALVGSATDAGERYEPGDLDPPPRARSSRRPARSAAGRSRAGRSPPSQPPAPIEDTYGAGDCFAAGLTFALGRGDEPRDALALAAQCGATVDHRPRPVRAAADAGAV